MAERINIVQVHLGPELPQYLYDQLEQTRVFNPEEAIYLLLGGGARCDEEALDRFGVVVVRMESIARCKNHDRFVKRNRLGRKGLGGFWRYAFERFFAIESFLEACRLRNVVHMENDVMLYAPLGERLAAFQERCPHIGLTMDSESRCVPGFMFLRDPASLAAMNGYFIDSGLRKHKNDMHALGSYMRNAAPSACSALPTIPSRYRSLYPLANASGELSDKPWYDEAFDAFGGIFDAAAIG
jgi:hypothetical protein